MFNKIFILAEMFNRLRMVNIIYVNPIFKSRFVFYFFMVSMYFSSDGSCGENLKTEPNTEYGKTINEEMIIVPQKKASPNAQVVRTCYVDDDIIDSIKVKCITRKNDLLNIYENLNDALLKIVAICSWKNHARYEIYILTSESLLLSEKSQIGRRTLWKVVNKDGSFAPTELGRQAKLLKEDITEVGIILFDKVQPYIESVAFRTYSGGRVYQLSQKLLPHLDVIHEDFSTSALNNELSNSEAQEGINDKPPATPPGGAGAEPPHQEQREGKAKTETKDTPMED